MTVFAAEIIPRGGRTTNYEGVNGIMMCFYRRQQQPRMMGQMARTQMQK